MSQLDLQTERTEGCVHLALSGELDLASAPELLRALARVEAERPGLILLDLRDLRFMDSTGLRTVVGADMRAREDGRRVAVVRGPEAVDRIFALTRIDERLEMLDEAPAGGAAG